MKIRLLEDDLQKPTNTSQSSDDTAPNELGIDSWDTPNGLEKPQTLKDWTKYILDAGPSEYLNVVQDWLNTYVEDNRMANSDIPTLKLIHNWITAYKTVEDDRNPFISTLLYITNELKIKPTYDDLVSINNSYADGNLTDKDLSGGTRSPIIKCKDLYGKSGTDQEDYIYYYKLLGSKEFMSTLEKLKSNKIFSNYNFGDPFFSQVFETGERKVKVQVGNQMYRFEKTKLDLDYWLKNPQVFRNAIMFVGDATNKDISNSVEELKLRPLDDIRAYLDKLKKLGTEFKSRGKPQQVSRQDLQDLGKLMKDKGLSKSDLDLVSKAYPTARDMGIFDGV